MGYTSVPRYTVLTESATNEREKAVEAGVGAAKQGREHRPPKNQNRRMELAIGLFLPARVAGRAATSTTWQPAAPRNSSPARRLALPRNTAESASGQYSTRGKRGKCQAADKTRWKMDSCMAFLRGSAFCTTCNTRTSFLCQTQTNRLNTRIGCRTRLGHPS